MLYIIIALAGLLVIVALFTFLSKRKNEQPEEITAPDGECCGAHAVCEKGLKKATPQIDYFDDEELDAFRDKYAEDYNDDEIDQFRDVLYTLRKEEIDDWFISLEKRGIAFPDKLKPEALDLIR